MDIDKVMRVVNWPARKGSNAVPWWLVVVRMAVLPLMVAGVLLYALAVLVGWGPGKVAESLDEVFPSWR